MIIQPVISENKGHEGYWIAFLCALILVVGALLLPFNSDADDHQHLEKHQVALGSLSQKPLAMIGELRLAYEEIRYFYQTEQTWMPVADLESLWIPPFVKDKTWLHQGEHHWELVAPGIYQSEPAKGGTRYLLNAQNDSVDIWFGLAEKSTLLEKNITTSSGFDTHQLIEKGWTQVVFSSSSNDTSHSH